MQTKLKGEKKEQGKSKKCAGKKKEEKKELKREVRITRKENDMIVQLSLQQRKNKFSNS